MSARAAVLRPRKRVPDRPRRKKKGDGMGEGRSYVNQEGQDHR